MKTECEHQFSYLEPPLEPNPTFESKIDLSHIPESILVPVHFTLEHKSIISPNHILLLDQGVERHNFEIVYKD